jgi:hypothetical protein
MSINGIASFIIRSLCHAVSSSLTWEAQNITKTYRLISRFARWQSKPRRSFGVNCMHILFNIFKSQPLCNQRNTALTFAYHFSKIKSGDLPWQITCHLTHTNDSVTMLTNKSNVPSSNNSPRDLIHVTRNLPPVTETYHLSPKLTTCHRHEACHRWVRSPSNLTLLLFPAM